MRNSSAKEMAFGGVFAALAIAIMNLGSLIPVATYICPVLCMLILSFVTKMCGSRIGWAWYGAVAIMTCLMAPDKEAAALFLILGYYPIVKPRFDRLPISVVFKLAFFNLLILAMYALLLRFIGMEQLAEEFSQMGKFLVGLTLAIGNLVFLVTDVALDCLARLK